MPHTYVIADLHGRDDLLEIAVQKAILDAGKEDFTFIVTGDMVDRGPNSKGVLDRLISLQKEHGEDKFIVLKGNHEDIMHQVMTDSTYDEYWHPELIRWWESNGGQATVRSYGYIGGDVRLPFPKGLADHLFWIKNLPLYHFDKYRAYVHEGFNPEKPIEEQDPEYMMWRYEKDWAGIDYDFHGRHVVHGHIQDENNPHLMSNKTNLDSFAWFTGRLAIGVFDDDVPGGPVNILWAEGPSYHTMMAGYGG